MSYKLFVGNLPFSLSESDVEHLFSQTGHVLSVRMPLNHDTGKKRGFAFVEMENESEGSTAISRFDGKDVQGRRIVVSEAKTRTDKVGPHAAAESNAGLV